ncbi:hypothetical protein [Vreelandella venusta]|uniref:Uncharacterized protein n=1 Tax=Vreelandella venusta TaxID=44935 RepID=A0ABX2B6P2_9GAMM|nr:hypothetical protein [Halomonas venusta]AZM95271.1 hypothetical protein EI420_06015 [Halomonas venusta]NPT29787.1 hypothetical protein [Halomonas venusta]QPI65253.1 hypothetical protein IR195_05955 [Halomonas venusta]
MKINVEFDLTPDEFRQSLGLPDVEAFQQSLLENIQRQMESGVDGYDPMSLMRPFLQQPMMQQGLSQGLANFGTYQQMMLDMLRKAGSSGSGAEQDGGIGQGESQEATKSAASGRSASSARSSKAKATASSRSRTKG